MNALGITLTEFGTLLGIVALIGIGWTMLRRWFGGRRGTSARTGD
jgi:hypothetical protein